MYRLLSNMFTGNLNPILSAVCADGCAAGSTFLNTSSQVLSWSEVSIGTVAKIMCPCRVTVPFKATRLCAGDFTSGGQWQEPDDSECNFDDVGSQLCQLPEVKVLTILAHTSFTTVQGKQDLVLDNLEASESGIQQLYFSLI